MPPSLAHHIIYGGIDYARGIGFVPHEDFALAQHILEPREAIAFDEDVTFGLAGKPHYQSGPNDNVVRILNHLEKTLGADGFYFTSREPEGESYGNIDDDLGRTQ